MARTQAQDYDQKRETITDAAASLFASKGFAGASVSDLAARCEVSKSLIYHYYPSKEAVLYGVMSKHVDDLLDAIADFEDSVGDAQTAEKVLGDMARALLEAYAGAAEAQKVLLYELSYLPAEQQQEIVQKERQIVATFENCLAVAKPEFAKTKGLLRTKVMLFFGMINWSHTWFDPKGQISRDELSDMAVATILGKG